MRLTASDSGSPAVDRHHHEERGDRIFNLFGVALDDPIERCIAVLVHLTTLGRGRIQLRAMPQLAGAEIFSYFADAQFDVIPAEIERATFRADSPERHMHMRVFGVVVGCRHPFERHAEVLLHP